MYALFTTNQNKKKTKTYELKININNIKTPVRVAEI